MPEMSMKGIVINIRVYTIRPHVCLSLAFRRQRPIYVLYIVANIAEHITLITVSVQSTGMASSTVKPRSHTDGIEAGAGRGEQITQYQLSTNSFTPKSFQHPLCRFQSF